MKPNSPLAAGALVFAIAASLGMTPASAARDTTPPTLNTPVLARYVIGGGLQEFTAIDKFYNVPMTFSWSATDAGSGLNSFYTVREFYAGDFPASVQESTSTSYAGPASDYSDEQGGGSFNLTNWSVQVSDNAGNSTERTVYGAEPKITQDDGTSSGAGNGPTASVAYTGVWGSSSCTCFANGTTRNSSVSGARVDVAVTISADREESWVGLVMEKASNRGKFKVRVDGVLQGTIDTLSTATQHQVIVWQTHLTTGAHTISVVNQATAGRPRIDLDAVVTN